MQNDNADQNASRSNPALLSQHSAVVDQDTVMASPDAGFNSWDWLRDDLNLAVSGREQEGAVAHEANLVESQPLPSAFSFFSAAATTPSAWMKMDGPAAAVGCYAVYLFIRPQR